ncbi:UNVERIFIED_CONTAM: hypothetical protein Sindi_0420900 [Sesamum indicum]
MLNASPTIHCHLGGNRLTAVELRTCNAENVNNNLLPDLEKRSVTPALDAVWKEANADVKAFLFFLLVLLSLDRYGSLDTEESYVVSLSSTLKLDGCPLLLIFGWGSFRIHDDHRHRVLNPQIHAHPATRVRRKIHEFSKQMPKVLHFHLVPYKKFWINLFQDYIPDERDIGLYFFPGDSERYEDYAFLLDYISFRNLALRKQIADVELLVFPSRLLPANCQCWNGKRFLWGVFHRLKQDTSARLDNREIKLSVQPSSHNPKSDMEEVDMDIDMVGGINVGRIDVPVHERPLREKHIPSRQESLSASISGRAFDPVTMPPLNVVEPCPAIPPGFGEVFRLRVQDSSLSLVKNVEVHEGKSKEQDDHHSLYSSSAEGVSTPSMQKMTINTPRVTSPTRILMAIDRLPALQWPKVSKEGPQLPKSKYFYREHKKKEAPDGEMSLEDINAKGIIHMIAGGPTDRDLRRAKGAHARATRTVMEIDDKAPIGGPMIHFGPADALGVHLPHLVISATVANYIVQLIFMDSGSSTDVLWYKVFQQMEDILLEPVDTL